MKIVLDTDVLVSGLLSAHGPPGEIVRMVSSGTLRLCYDARILTEYREVLLRPKFAFSEDLVDALLEQVQARGVLVASGPLAHELPDPDDEPFLEVALAGRAAALVTGNLRHYPAGRSERMFVVSPARFPDHYRRKKRAKRKSRPRR